MDMCYDGTLVMPSSYAVMEEDEMCYVEGGVAPIAVITATIAVMGASYGTGTICGEKLYYSGINSSKKWSKYKWQARAAIYVASPIMGTAFLLGLENKLYSMFK